MRFIGDVHGKWARYKTIIEGCDASIQVGDFGVGFRHPYSEIPMANPPYDAMIKGNHRFIRGNHDNPNACKTQKLYIADGTIEGNVMFIGGAFSIDRAFRTENYTWWADEELSNGDLNRMMDIYLEHKPEIMVTHECPDSIAMQVFPFMKGEYPSRTRQAFEGMWDMHKPKLWIYGHWHHSVDQEISGTRFICLNELEYKDIDLN